MKKILLIVPCFNEEERIDFKALERGIAANLTSEITLSLLFTNDGSNDGTRSILENFCSTRDYAKSYHLNVNSGKGNAIQECYQNMKSSYNYLEYDWIGFWDADLATPLDQIPLMLNFLNFYKSQDVAAIWGARISRLGSHIKRQMHRHYLGRIFVTVVSNVLKVKAYDSQCGAKLFTPQAAEIAFDRSFISRWIFDVEILLRLKEERIIEFPLFHWEDVPGSKVKIFREMFRVATDLIKIRKAYNRY